MKAHFPRQISYYEIDPEYKLKLGNLFKLIQESAIYHSDSVGLGSVRTRSRGFAWFLNKVGVKIYRYPEYKENIEIITWFREAKRFKSYRDYEIFSGEEKIAEASSIWIYFDTDANRISTIPSELCETYTLEQDSKSGPDLEAWEIDSKFEPDLNIDVTTRISDFDPNFHINSAVYIDYLETLIPKIDSNSARIKTLVIEYKKEIDRSVPSVNVACKHFDDHYLFKVTNNKNVYAYGNLFLE